MYKKVTTFVGGKGEPYFEILIKEALCTPCNWKCEKLSVGKEGIMVHAYSVDCYSYIFLQRYFSQPPIKDAANQFHAL